MNAVPSYRVFPETLTDWISNIRSLSSELNRRHVQIEEMTADLANKDSTISRLRTDLEAKEYLVVELERTVGELQRAYEIQMEQLDSQLRNAEEQRREGEERLCEIERRVEQQDAKLAEKDETIRQLGIDLGERESEAEQLESLVTDVETLRQGTEQTVTELKRHIDVAAEGICGGVGSDVGALKRSVGDLNGSVTGEFGRLRKHIRKAVDNQLTQASETIGDAIDRLAADLREGVPAAKQKITEAVEVCVRRFDELKAQLDSRTMRRPWMQLLLAVLGIATTLALGLPLLLVDVT